MVLMDTVVRSSLDRSGTASHASNAAPSVAPPARRLGCLTAGAAAAAAAAAAAGVAAGGTVAVVFTELLSIAHTLKVARAIHFFEAGLSSVPGAGRGQGFVADQGRRSITAQCLAFVVAQAVSHRAGGRGARGQLLADGAGLTGRGLGFSA
jgi:hypothetical protein